MKNKFILGIASLLLATSVHAIDVQVDPKLLVNQNCKALDVKTANTEVFECESFMLYIFKKPFDNATPVIKTCPKDGSDKCSQVMSD